LEPKIRQFFRYFVPTAIKRGLCVSIVTFSGQVDLISQLLSIAFGALASEIVIRGNDLPASWDYAGDGSKLQKQRHMASAAEEMMRRKGDIDITMISTILIDDDDRNIREAIRNGTPAVLFHPESPETFSDEILAVLHSISKV
jgi:hypothetical protein